MVCMVLTSVALCALAVPLVRPLGLDVIVWRSSPSPPAGPFQIRERDVTLRVPSSATSQSATVHARLWYPDAFDVARLEVPVSGNFPPGRDGWPLVIFAPGWGGRRDECSILVRELASHGLVVAGLDDIMHDSVATSASPEDEAARLSGGDFSTEVEQAQSLNHAIRRVRLTARKISAAIDALLAAGDGSPSSPPLFGRIGVLGYSLGGSAAAEAAITDRRIAVAVNMDGWVLANAAQTETLAFPYVQLNSTLPHFTEFDLKSTRALRRFMARMSLEGEALQLRQAASPDALILDVEGSLHSDYTDELFNRTRWHNWRPWRGRLIEPRAMQRIIVAYVSAAFDRHLRRLPTPLIAQKRSLSPEVKVIGSPSPVTH